MSNPERPEVGHEEPLESIIDLIRKYEQHGVAKQEAWNNGLGADVHETARRADVESRMTNAREAMTALRPILEARGVVFDSFGQIDLEQSTKDVRAAVAEYNEALKHKKA